MLTMHSLTQAGLQADKMLIAECIVHTVVTITAAGYMYSYKWEDACTGGRALAAKV